ncbi:hypothetical protein NQ315_010680 [Exocentrus adspersus]|uniref:Transcription factor CBF/NF-Y/archaeal histone domain-containing protein n=1 Tax=Exocentrus adspersus TaxID=1586481 RepID=A0AAV8VUS7_9CUCU|nr:hypothetical protein NQ315_010680 [Exocentrus adspersus]
MLLFSFSPFSFSLRFSCVFTDSFGYSVDSLLFILFTFIFLKIIIRYIIHYFVVMDDIEVCAESEQVNEEIDEAVEVNTVSEFESADANETLNKNTESLNQRHKFLRLPLSRVKAMMKKDPDCDLLSQDAVFLTTKATEMFIDFMTRESAKHVTVMGKRKTVSRKDVETVIQNIPELCFLDGALD